MELLVFVLNHHEKLDAVLTELEHAGVAGATVIDSTGMAKFFGAIRGILNSATRAKSNTILMVIEKDQVQPAVDAIERVVGDLNHQNVGVVFTIPVEYTKGIRRHE